MSKLLRTEADILEAYRERIRELGLTHQTVDAIAGWADGYCSKVMCGMKNVGPKARELLNGALGIAFVAMVDEEAAARVQRRWVKRKRPLKNLPQLPPPSMPPSIDNQVPMQIQVTPELQRQIVDSDHMRRIGKMGAKKRNKNMKKRARQRAAQHAARKRWARRAGAP